ncbi:site-specific integrase [Methylocystis sp. SB2]|uniref:tyrosine-type recombinase/integrase n=1 Tax=Methylocystis sp. (strain SB2) TaxID=743836 RepID=UPI00041C7010|nr:site-specific integrase [Methylocystis sp. SB2]ULO23138.1 integrase arm-type DNA-binding domain-containing protein [Methylocystis sp. SB2]
MAKVLTQVAIEAIRPGSARREVPDGKVTGLYLVIQPSGARSWALRYRFGAHPRKLTVGGFPAVSLADARKAAQAALGELARGNDPAAQKREAKVAAKATALAEKRAELDVVEKVVDEFIERYAKPNTRDWKETQRLLRKDVVAAWKGRRLSEIGNADIHRLFDKMVDRGAAVTANRVFAQFRKLCRWAVSRGIIEKSPCEGIEAPTTERPRDRVLDERELSVVWRAAGELGFPYADIVRLLVLTGARRDEVAHAQWSEIDLEKRLWTLPAERSKNRRPHSNPLAPAAVEIIKGLPRFEGSDFLFSTGKTPPSGFSKAKARLDVLVAEHNGGAPIPHFVIHDIRRSVASGLASIGIPIHVIERCLNHVSGSFGGIVSVYQKHSYADEMRAALEAWSRHVDRIVSGAAAGNVVELAIARA